MAWWVLGTEYLGLEPLGSQKVGTCDILTCWRNVCNISCVKFWCVFIYKFVPIIAVIYSVQETQETSCTRKYVRCASCLCKSTIHVSWAWVGYKTNPNVCNSGKIACQTETKCAWVCICLFVTRDLFHIACRRISYPLFCFLLVSDHSRWPSAVTFYVRLWMPLSCQ